MDERDPTIFAPQTLLAPSPPPPGGDPSIFDPVGHFMQTKAQSGADFADVRPVLEQAGVDAAGAEGRYKLDARRSYESQRQETAQEFVSKRVFPFASAIGNVAQEARYKRVMDQVNAGTVPSDADTEFAARHEHLQQFKAERQATLPGQLAEAVAGMPALIGEAMVTRLPGMGMGKGLVANTARSAVQAPLMPSLYAEQAAENATRKGGDVTDFKNLAPPLAMAAVQNVVLGRLQARAAGSTVPTAAGRYAYAGALGVGEQAGLDVAAGAVDEVLPDSLKTETKYGVLGDLARGLASGRADNKAVTHATVQALTFAAFAAALGRPHGPVIEKFTAAADALHDAGIPAEAAGPVLADAVERVQQAPDQEAATEALKQLPDGPLKDYVKEAVVPTLPERRLEDVGPPEGMADRRAKPVVNLETTREGRTMDGRPELRLKVTDADGKHVADAVVHPTGDKTRGDEGDVHVDFVGRPGSSPTDAAGGIGEGLNRAIQEKIAASFPDATHITGYRQSGARSPENLVKNNPELADLSPDDRQRAIRSLQFTRVKIPGREAKPEQPAERPPEVPPEPVTVTGSPQPVEPQDASRSLRVEKLTLGGAIVAAKQIGIKTDGVTLAKLKVMLRNHFGDDLPERYRDLIHGPAPVAINRVLPEAGPEGLSRPAEPGLGAPAGPPAAPLVENVNPGVARMRARQAALEKAGLVPKAATGVDEGVGLGRFNARLEGQPLPVKLSPNQMRAKTWALLKRAEEVSRTLRERAARGGEDLPEPAVPEVPLKPDPDAWKMRVLRSRLLSGRQLISDAMKDPTPEKVAAGLGAVESIRRATEANGERGRSMRDKAFPGWAEVEKRFAPEQPNLPPAGEPVTVTGKGKLKPTRTPEEVAAANARRIANLKQNKTAVTWPGEIRSRGGISPESAAEYWDAATFRTAGGKLKQQFLDREGLKSTRHIDDVLDELVNDKLMVPNDRQHRSDQLLELIQGKGPSPAGLESKAGQQQIQNALDNHYRQEALNGFHQRLKNDNPSWSDAQIERAGAELLAAEEARGRADAADGADATGGQGGAAGSLGRDQLRAAGGGAGPERGGHPEVPDAAAEAADAAAPAAEGGLDLSFDFGHNAVEFGRPLSPAERRTSDVGGGQGDAGPVGSRGPNETALANAKVDAERVKNGLPPMMAAARRANPAVWDQAMARLASDPNASARLVDELAGSSRATTVDENALLLHRKVALSNEYERTMRGAIDAMVRKDTPEFDRLDVRATELLGQIDRLDGVTRSTGTGWGRAGQFRRQLAREDFSLGRMMMEAERAKREPLTTEEKAEITDLHEKIKSLEEQLEKLKETGGKTPGGKDGADVEVEINRKKRDYKEKIEDYHSRHRPVYQKVIEGGADSASFVRSFMTSFDLSAVLRQGAILGYAHPVLAAKSFVESLKSFADTHHFERSELLIRQRANALLYKQSGLYLADRTGPPTAQEEAFVGRWARKLGESKPGESLLRKVATLPFRGVAASERAYTGYLNRLRADVFDSMTAGLARNGQPSPAEAKAVANFINIATGRGKLPVSLDRAAAGLAHVFFSPRYVVSRFQILAGQPFYGGTMRTRGAIAKEFGRSLAGLGVFYGVMAALNRDAEFTWDPRSADFGKVKMGRFRVDPLAGLAQTIVFLTKVGGGETKSTETKKLSPLRGAGVPYGGQTTSDVISRFVRSKLAPVPGVAADVVTGETVIGEPVTAKREAAQLAVPISVKDVYDAMRTQGVPRGQALALLAILGMGTQEYEPRQKRLLAPAR